MHLTKRILAMLLALVLVLGVFPAVVSAENVRPEDKAAASEAPASEAAVSEAPNYGLIHQYHYGTNGVTEAYLRGEAYTVNGVNLARANRALPSKWDNRDQGWGTSVKNQNPYGSCWAHAAVASVESYMIKEGIPVGTGAAATTSLNLSETQHCFFNYSSAYDAEGMLTGDKSTPQDSCLDQGGNGEMSAYTLQRWTGVADESVAALAYNRASTVNSSGLDSQYAYNYNVAHVQNSEWIPATNIDAVKQAIMDYGAGNISYYETGNAYTYSCTIDTTSQESSSHKWANHAITLIGWDDSISRTLFSPNKPTKNGAWLCKNSWGTSQFDGGYCWISYEDTSVLEGYIYFYDAEPIDNYGHNYQYDGTCNVVCFGKGWPSGADYYEGFANGTKVANVFTAQGNESLRAVGLCSWDEGLDYTVEIYKNPTVGNPSSGTKMATQTGTLTFSGYYTIKLDTPVTLLAGDTFSVVVTQSCATADENGKYIHTPYDATFNDSSVVSWCSWIHANHGNTSYYQEPNGQWTDCPDNGDYRIKAYTDDILFNLTAVSNNNAWGTVSVDGRTITASPAAGYYAAGAEVLVGEATVTRNGNVFTVSASEDCTVRINFAPKEAITVTYMASGAVYQTVTSYSGDDVILPASAAEYQGWSFIGWSETTVEETTEKPAFYAPGATVNPLESTTYHAVYSRVEIDESTIIYQLADAPANGGKFILVAEDSISGTTGYAVGNTIVSSNHYLTPVAVTVNADGTCSAAAANLPKVLWKASGSGASYSFYNEAVGKYMGLDSSEYLYPSATALAWLYTAEGYLNNQVDSEGYYYLSYSNSPARYTTSKSGAVIRFYQETNPSVDYYSTMPVDNSHEHVLEHYEAVAPTCTEAGRIEYWQCTVCGRCFADANAEHEIALADTVLPAAGHVAGDPVTENEIAATCTKSGGYDTVVYCSVCGAEMSRVHTKLPALGHDWGEWTVTAEPTCTEAGEETRACARCDATETRPVEALGHDLIHHEAQAPTCTEPGWDAYDTCSRCDYTTFEVVPAAGHTPGEAVKENETAATCTEVGGYDTVTYCAVCGEELSREHSELAALGHDLAYAYAGAGTHTATCSRCDYTFTEACAYEHGVCIHCGALENPFVDVIEGEFYYDAVLWAFYHDPQITKGTDSTHFSPKNTCKRRDVVTFLWRANGCPEPTETENPFTDVPDNAYYTKAVLWAVEKGITTGTGKDTFSPTATCKRRDVVTFLWRAKGCPTPTETENPFTDVPAGKYYTDAVLWAVEAGITTGTTATTFSPAKTCTRGQIVTFLYRAYN